MGYGVLGIRGPWGFLRGLASATSAQARPEAPWGLLFLPPPSSLSINYTTSSTTPTPSPIPVLRPTTVGSKHDQSSHTITALQPRNHPPSQPTGLFLLSKAFSDPFCDRSLPSSALGKPWSHPAIRTCIQSSITEITAVQDLIRVVRHGPIDKIIRLTPFTLQLQSPPPCRNAVGRMQICPHLDLHPASNQPTTSPSHLTHTRPRTKPPQRRTALRSTNLFPLPKPLQKFNAPIPPLMEPPVPAQHLTLAKCLVSRERSRHAPPAASKR